MLSKINQVQKDKWLIFSVLVRHEELHRLPDRQTWTGAMAR